MAVPDHCVEAMLRNSPGSGHPDVIGPIWGSLGGHLDPSGGHSGDIWTHRGSIGPSMRSSGDDLGTSEVHPGSLEGP